MNINELTKEQYLGTMDGMVDITHDHNETTVDIWPYVKELYRRGLLSKQMYESGIVELVYRNRRNSFHHALLRIEKNVYLVIVIEVERSAVYGHYLLDLNKEYGLMPV